MAVALLGLFAACGFLLALIKFIDNLAGLLERMDKMNNEQGGGK